tara:strand:- start:1711 stop:2838 length:1128 start_codon:yes stop_codon:yes gene_type:complete
MKPEIFSEIGSIEKVFVYSPGEEHNLVLPKDIRPYLESDSSILPNEDFLLFDDLVDLDIAKSQHEMFIDVINFYKKDSCVNIRSDFQRIIDSENIANDYPLINLMYPRDIAVVIGKQIFLTSSSSKVRKAENLITESYFRNNIIYQDCDIIDFKKINDKLSLEGGDIFVLNRDVVMIGISERTSLEAIELIVPYIFEQTFKKVIAVNLPKERAMMHLDTIFTQTSHNEAIMFNGKDYNIKELEVFVATKGSNSNKMMKKNYKFFHVLKDFGFNLISCGGSENNFMLREQLTDGANSFALEPGKIIMYSCNYNTIKDLEKNNYKHISSKSLYTDQLTFDKILRSNSKVVITIDGSELVKGRGGPRCMTLPIRRGNL